jgi:acetyl esterase/lipase
MTSFHLEQSARELIEYSRAPEANHPVQIEQCYAAAQWIREQGADSGFDITRIAVAGDSAGGNMSTVLALMAKQRGGVQFVHQSLYYPMTDANAEDSLSLRRFKDGPYGSAEGLAWFWNSYLTVEESRSDILVSPLQPASPRGRHVQAATGHGGRQQGESPKSGDDLLLPAAILGVVTSLRTRTADRDVPRQSREKQ